MKKYSDAKIRRLRKGAGCDISSDHHEAAVAIWEFLQGMATLQSVNAFDDEKPCSILASKHGCERRAVAHADSSTYWYPLWWLYVQHSVMFVFALLAIWILKKWLVPADYGIHWPKLLPIYLYRNVGARFPVPISLANALHGQPREGGRGQLLGSLPSVLHDEDKGIAEALCRDAEFEANPSLGMTLEELDQQIENLRS